MYRIIIFFTFWQIEFLSFVVNNGKKNLLKEMDRINLLICIFKSRHSFYLWIITRSIKAKMRYQNKRKRFNLIYERSAWESLFLKLCQEISFERHLLCTWPFAFILPWTSQKWNLFLKCLPLGGARVQDANANVGYMSQQTEWAPSEDSDLPGHPSSLIRVFAVRSMGR